LRCALEQAGSLDTLPWRVRDILEGGWMIAAQKNRSLRWEVDRIKRAFHGTGLPVILLKGAAYELLNLPLARGRLVADVDILLPLADLPLAEACLHAHGWQTTKPDPYDQRYYREWMHELPPMRHRQRLTELDLHHTILPRSGRLRPDAARLLAAVVPVPGLTGVWTLSPMDRILHAASQLFYDSDFGPGGLRDLLDLDALLRPDDRTEDFGTLLVARAEALELLRPLYYALFFLESLCQTPVPVRCGALTGKKNAPGWLAMTAMGWLVPRALLPLHPDRRRDGPGAGFARWCLYLRAHWLRMPPGLLLRHLARKWARKWSFHVWHRRTV
ncbi:MAG: nucleotidyltransferase family protein, partial [Magnetococcales bacterium]|nr:nucleotidyltransferase family protein [Magnetococcales bacterium]